MNLQKRSLGDVAALLTEPFSMVEMAHVEDVSVSLYLCQGAVPWHRHLDQDELFWVYQGTISLQSEQGHLEMNEGDMALVRKGLSHRSSASEPATVILIRSTTLSHQKNGRLRLYGTAESALERVSLPDLRDDLSAPYKMLTAAHVDRAVLQVVRGEGEWPALDIGEREVMLVVMDGDITLSVSGEDLLLQPDDVVVIPRTTDCQMTSTAEAFLVLMSCQELDA
jgi:mannose-6-phosphate isomerase-like protein (cupin superfamily)